MSGPKNPADKYDYMAKVVILGDSAVGKTNILLRYTSQEYKPTHLATVGVDFKIKTVQIGSTRIKLQLWDTAGQQRFKTITETYYKGASGIILVYAINDRKTFNSITTWMNQIAQHNEQDIPKIIVGNKSDLPSDERVVSEEEGMQLGQKYNVPWIETSARDGTNINELFGILGKAIADKFEKSSGGGMESTPGQGPVTGGTMINQPAPKEKKQCCGK